MHFFLSPALVEAKNYEYFPGYDDPQTVRGFIKVCVNGDEDE